MCDEDVEYYEARAEQELDWAQRAAHADAARAHFIIAGHYLDLVHNSPSPPEKPLPKLWQ